MLSNALYYPWRGGDAAGTALIGGLLSLLAALFGLGGAAVALATPVGAAVALVALAPLALVFGYGVRTLRAVIADERAPPSFTDWNALFLDGVRALFVLAVYALPAALVGAAVLGLFVLASRTTAGAAAVVPAVLGSLLLVVVVLLVAYLQPIGLAALAHGGSIRSAFGLRTVVRVALSGEYAVGWLLAQSIALVVLSVGLPLSALLVGFPLVFVAFVMAQYLFGRSFAAAVVVPAEEHSGPPAPATDGSVDLTEFVADVGASRDLHSERDGEPERERRRDPRRDDAAVDRTEFVADVPNERQRTEE